MKALKIGVIGTGHMGRNHVRNLSDEKRFELVGIYDADKAQSSQVAEQYGVRAFDTVDELLGCVDAVIVAVPSSLHKDVALKVADKGVHALVEKPLATTSEDAEIIVNEFNKKT